MKTLLGTMNAQRIRFLLVKGHAPDDMLAVYEEAVKASAGRGILTPWVQQYAVLAHKVLRPLLRRQDIAEQDCRQLAVS